MSFKGSEPEADSDGSIPAAADAPSQRVSSPASTGGAGTTFEQHVGAYWLAQLLVGALPPILIDTTVRSVAFQTEHLGWHTDDFLVECERQGAVAGRLVGQVKRGFTVSASDEECAKAVGDFWKDFNGSRFSKTDDRLVLVTQRGTNTLLEHFAGLLDCVRASSDGADFERRLSVDGFVSDTAIRYCGALRDIIGALEGRPVTVAELWPFLRTFYVLSLDLFSSTRLVEVQMKALLAYTCKDGDLVAAAASTWDALVAEASAAQAQARILSIADLPALLRARHSRVNTPEQRILQTLKEHTDITLRLIRGTIGDTCHLQRAKLVQQVLQALEDAQVVLIAGPAGSGKSSVAKDTMTALSTDHFTFGFRVEEFAQPHFDNTLDAAQVPANAATLRAVLAAQERNIILVESVERLLERSTRDAFSDLMVMARGDGAATRVILTCRDYSVELVRASFLQPARIKYAVVQVPPLDDLDLALVEQAHTALAIPLKHTALRDILRNPFFLDKALEIDWSGGQPVPQSERDFRALFWRDIVRADHRVAAGMGRHREKVLQDIAVRRARALSPNVPANDLDPAVVEALRRDSLIISPSGTPGLVATAHDVLEDWAILQWLDELYLTDMDSLRAWSDSIGTHPAIRRSYRKWVGELVERDPDAADKLFASAIADTTTTIQFRDDTLAALLRAPTAPSFLARHEADLLANDRVILKRVIHLLRVACVKAPAWFEGGGLLFTVPDGAAWAAVLQVVQQHLAEFPSGELLLLLGLIDDWGSGVSVWTPYPKGAVAAAAIAFSLLPRFDTYREDSAGRRILKLLAKIPRAADPQQIEALLRGGHAHRDEERTSGEFQELILSGMEGVALARDFPDLLVEVAQTFLFCTQEELEREFRGSSLGVELNFGLKENLHHGTFPPSAYRGPWLPLLRHHLERGLDLFESVFNHSADWYVNPRVHRDLEPATEITLTFADGTKRTQWANGRFWNLYRSTSVAPNILESMAMALERSLFELAESKPAALDATLLSILRRTDSGALTAVVASVATAFPHASGETLLVLLSSLELVRLDSYRVVSESSAPSSMHGMFGPARGADEIYQQERKDADALPHRTSHLEIAILNLQFGPLAPRVHQILDAHRASFPVEGARSAEDKVWLLSIARMDLRQYDLCAEAPEPSATSDQAEVPRTRIRLEPKLGDADVQQMVEEKAGDFAEQNARLGLLMWGRQVFDRDSSSDPTQWRSRLSEAMAFDVSRMRPEEMGIVNGAPAWVAVVCARDYWSGLTPDERRWCVERICAEVMVQPDTWDQTARVQRHPMSADRPCASIVSLLLTKTLEPPQRSLVERAFVFALTHPVGEVQWYAISGVARHLAKADQPLALRSVDALAQAATLVDQAREIEHGKPYDQRKPLELIETEVAALIRERFWTADGIPEDAHARLDSSGWFGADAMARILAIFAETPTEPASIAAYTRAAEALAGWWEDGDDRRSSRRSARRERNHETESAVSDFIQRFVIRTTKDAAVAVLKPILDTVDRPVRDLHWFVRGLTSAEDQLQKTEQFWFVWTLFANKIRRASWLPHLADEYSVGDELSSAIFLGSYWKDGVRHWRSLERHVGLVDTLFDDLPPSSRVLDDYVRFLYHVGERSMPAAFVRINAKLQAGPPAELLEKRNTVFMLESLLQRFVYGRPLELKNDPAVRKAVLELLDVLVENGSSAAFRMRDDFVTPIA